MNRTGQTTNFWKMSAIVISLSALVLVTLAVYAPGNAAAADSAFLADGPQLMGALCAEAVTEVELGRTYGTFAGCWYANADIESDRNYGTFAGVWTGYIDRLTESQRNYGTFAGVWTGYNDRVAAQNSAILAANPELLVARQYYYYTAAPEMATGAAAFLASNPELLVARR